MSLKKYLLSFVFVFKTILFLLLAHLRITLSAGLNRANFSLVYGKLVYNGDYKIFPLAHPAAILYRIEPGKAIERDFAKMKKLKSECKWYPVCPMKSFFEAGKLDKKWIDMYCQGDWKNCIRYQM